MRHGPFDNKDHQNTHFDVKNKPKFNIPLTCFGLGLL